MLSDDWVISWGGGEEYRENGEQLHFGCGEKKGNYASVV